MQKQDVFVDWCCWLLTVLVSFCEHCGWFQVDLCSDMCLDVAVFRHRSLHEVFNMLRMHVTYGSGCCFCCFVWSFIAVLLKAQGRGLPLDECSDCQQNTRFMRGACCSVLWSWIIINYSTWDDKIMLANADCSSFPDSLKVLFLAWCLHRSVSCLYIVSPLTRHLTYVCVQATV